MSALVRGFPKVWELNMPSATVTFACDIPPSVNALYQNVPGKGRVKTALYSAWEKRAGFQVNKITQECVLGRYGLSLVVRRPKSARRDIDNVIKAISDLAVTMGLVQDDCLCEEIFIRWTDDADVVGVVGTITAIPVR
jgi:Holliday junction resolvase RusA-like endonuclease